MFVLGRRQLVIGNKIEGLQFNDQPRKFAV